MSEPAKPAAQPQRGRQVRLLLASSNPGKLREYRALAAAGPADICINLDLLPGFSQLPAFDESAPTFAENAAGKAVHYSRFSPLPLIADDSGLVVDALGGAPGVHSARYAGEQATNAERIAKLLGELRRVASEHGAGRQLDSTISRAAHFVCIIALASAGNLKAVLSDSVSGEVLDAGRGLAGFGYDPIFLLPAIGKTFAEVTEDHKNLYSHRGKAFRKLVEFHVRSPML